MTVVVDVVVTVVVVKAQVSHIIGQTCRVDFCTRSMSLSQNSAG